MSTHVRTLPFFHSLTYE